MKPLLSEATCYFTHTLSLFSLRVRARTRTDNLQPHKASNAHKRNHGLQTDQCLNSMHVYVKSRSTYTRTSIFAVFVHTDRMTDKGPAPLTTTLLDQEEQQTAPVSEFRLGAQFARPLSRALHGRRKRNCRSCGALNGILGKPSPTFHPLDDPFDPNNDEVFMPKAENFV